jgi:hypothetical protein
MQRLKGFLSAFAWQVGLGYLLIWAFTFWTLDEGGMVFGRSGLCHTDSATVLFYWVCEPSSALAILAMLSNFALTVTVWAPVFVAAATVQPDAVSLAVPIVAVHAVGLPLGLFVLIRMMTTALDLKHKIPARVQKAAHAGANPSAAAPPAPSGPPNALRPKPRPMQRVKPRGEFGLRGGQRR